MIGLSLSSLGLGLGRRGSAFSPVSLFAAGEQGYWLDPFDFSTMFQDTAGTTPVTAVEQSVRRWLDKSGRGNHFTQSSTSNAPILGRNPIVGTRNLLTFTEQFDNAAWARTAATISANSTTAPNGTVTADTILSTASATGAPRITQNPSVAGGLAYTISAYFKASGTNFAFLSYRTAASDWAAAEFDLATGVVSRNASLGTVAYNGATITAVGSGWHRCTLTVTPTAVTQFVFLGSSDGTSSFLGGFPAFTNTGTETVFVWGAQLEAGSTATAYQRVGSAFDVTQSGVADAYYLAYDGTDDWLQSGTITPGTDKVQVFAGVRKLSDATRGSVLGFSTTPNASNGSFEMFAPGLDAEASYGIASRGTTQASTRGTTFAAPITNVLTGLGDISGDSAILRVNGTQANFSTADQGTGNYLAYPHYIGRRGGTSQPFNGRIYQLICRFGSNLTAAQIQQVESFVNSRTGAY